MVRSVCRHAGVERTSPKLPGLPQPEGATIFLRKSTSGLRPFDAVEKLRNEIRQSLNLLALYQQSQAPAVDPRGWVLSSDGAQEVQDRTVPLQNLHPRRDASSLADKAAAALNSREEPAIRAALELHSVALSSVDHRLRLVNLWSAIECLASLVEGETIISRVQKLVVPILTWRKVEKVVRYLAISIHCWLQKNPDIDRATCPIRLGHNDSVPPEQLLTLLAEPEDSKNILLLLNLVSGHPLLLYRIDRAWRTFNSPLVLYSNLKESSQRLEWHLWRIYRARNLLVHHGMEPRFIPQLANHLQQYFSWTLSRILHGLTFGPEWRATDSWTFWKSKSDHVLRSLKTNAKMLVVGDMFPEELPASHFPVWADR